MKNQSTTRYKIAFLAFGAIVLFSACGRNVSFQLPINESLKVASADSLVLKQSELDDFKAKGLIVDLRDPYSFVKNHIEGSVNLPANNILSEESYEELLNLSDQGRPILLVGRDMSESNRIWFLLHQIGFSDVWQLEGGFDGLAPSAKDSLIRLNPEIPLLDFAAEMKKTAAPETRSEAPVALPAKKKVILKPVEKPAAAEGGC